MQMLSVIKFPYQENWDEMANSIVAVTRSRIRAVVIQGNTVAIEIEHHDGPVCPHCGRDIHAYGHGLCLACWNIKNPIGR